MYNDSINDLLGSKQGLPLREVAGRGIAPDGLTYEAVSDTAEVLAWHSIA